MSAKSEASAPVKSVVIVRTFDAPRDLVFKAWTSAEHMRHWFGPEGFTVPVCEADFRVGGTSIVTMRAPNGDEFRSRGTFLEIVPPERLVIASSLLDDNDNSRFDDRNVVTFREEGGKTVVTVEASITAVYDPTAAGALAGMEQGWSETLARLGAYVSTLGSVPR